MHHISAQNEGKHILATSIFHNFLGEHAPRPPSRVTPSASKMTALPWGRGDSIYKKGRDARGEF